MDALVIGGHFSTDHEDSLHHLDSFRLTADDVPMSIPNLVHYFENGRRFPDHDLTQRRIATTRRPYRQVYWSGLHMFDLLMRHGYEAELLNCHDMTDPRRLAAYKTNPKCVVLSTTFMNMEAVRKVVADVRAHLPDAWIVIGGCYTRYSYLVLERQSNPHYADERIRNRYFFTSNDPVKDIDCYVVDQHGEMTLLAAIEEVVRQGRRPRDVPNTVVPDGDSWHVNTLKPETYDIEAHRVRWRQIPRRSLATVVPFQNTYGCPFKCGFCNFSLTKVHKKSLDTLFAELHELAEHSGVQKIWFTDDNFFLNEKLVSAFCERYIEEDLPFAWMSFIRASSITPKTAELIRRSKGELLILGFESGSQTVLDAMEKNDTIPHYYEAASNLIQCGVDLEMSFIVGYPGETSRTVDDTIEFLASLPVNEEQISYLYLFKFNVVPLSPIFDGRGREQWNLEGTWDRWSHRTMRSEKVYGQINRIAAASRNTVFNYLDPANGLSRRELVRLMKTRDDVARSILTHGRESATTGRAWDTLENAVRGHFLQAEKPAQSPHRVVATPQFSTAV